MTAIEPRAREVDGDGDPKDDEEKSLSPAPLKKLEMELRKASSLSADSERQASIVAVNAVLEFLVSIPEWEARGLATPLWRLLTALRDLEFGRVGSMLEPNPRVTNRKPDAGMRKIVKAYALFCLDVLRRSGWSMTEGCTIIARTLHESGFPLGGRNQGPIWKSVKGWRDRYSKLARNDQTRDTLEGLNPHIESVGSLTKAEARVFVQLQLQEVISNIGKAALE